MNLDEEEILESYNSYIKNLSKGSKKLAEYFRTDKLEEGFEGILDLSEGLTWLSLSNEFLAAKNKIAKKDFSALQSFLLEINEGLKVRDYILVADILEYEIATYFEEN